MVENDAGAKKCECCEAPNPNVPQEEQEYSDEDFVSKIERP